jgi:hypothetical protein
MVCRYRHLVVVALVGNAAATSKKTQEEKAVASCSSKMMSLHLTTGNWDVLAARRKKALVEELAAVKKQKLVTKYPFVDFGRYYYSRLNKSKIARNRIFADVAALKKNAATCMRVGHHSSSAREERANAPQSKKQKYQQQKKKRHEKKHRNHLSILHIEFSGVVNAPSARNKCRIVCNRRYRLRVGGDHAEAREKSRYKHYDQHRTSPYVSHSNQAIIDEKLECLVNSLASTSADDSPSSTDETISHHLLVGR